MSATAADILKRLEGAWELVEWYQTQPDGTKTHPLGDDAIGQILYTADGHMSAQMARRTRQRLGSSDWRGADVDESARAFGEYFDYFGSFSIDTEREIVTHHIKGSWHPNLHGDNQERHYRFDGPYLILEASNTWGKFGVVWQRPEKVAIG
jgi:hypothetical protein